MDQTSEAENFDRDDLALPGVQQQLALAVIAAQPRAIVVMIHGGVISAPDVYDAAAVVLDCVYGGKLAGEAILDVLTGAVSPAGKLPVTIYFPNATSYRVILSVWVWIELLNVCVSGIGGRGH